MKISFLDPSTRKILKMPLLLRVLWIALRCIAWTSEPQSQFSIVKACHTGNSLIFFFTFLRAERWLPSSTYLLSSLSLSLSLWLFWNFHHTYLPGTHTNILRLQHAVFPTPHLQPKKTASNRPTDQPSNLLPPNFQIVPLHNFPDFPVIKTDENNQ